MSKAQNIVGSFVTAMRTLTILPVPGKDTERPADALYYFPVVGAIIGALVQLVAWLLGSLLHWPAGAAAAGVLALVWLTRALHLDGLSDTVDACFASPERGRRLAIMKDPHIGAFGAAAIILALLCKAVSLEKLCSTGHGSWIILPVVFSRAVMVLAVVCLPYARSEGGKAQPFFSGARPAHFWAAGSMAVVLSLVLAGITGLFAALLALMLSMAAVWWMKKAFGGATGDLLGFTGEAVECVLYFFLAAIANVL